MITGAVAGFSVPLFSNSEEFAIRGKRQRPNIVREGSEGREQCPAGQVPKSDNSIRTVRGQKIRRSGSEGDGIRGIRDFGIWIREAV